MKELFAQFSSVISDGEIKLRIISDEKSTVKPGLNAWSSKEILGHLADSSINNSIRFVEGRFREDLVFNGYDQDKWVSAQNYQSANWEFLIDLWRLNNLQILRSIQSIPAEKLQQKHNVHNFDEIAFREISKNYPASLDYLIRDYLDHMKYHLNAIFRLNEIEPMR